MCFLLQPFYYFSAPKFPPIVESEVKKVKKKDEEEKEEEYPYKSREAGFDEGLEFGESFAKQFSGFKFKMVKVKPVGGISEEGLILFDSRKVAMISPRRNCIFGVYLWDEHKQRTSHRIKDADQIIELREKIIEIGKKIKASLKETKHEESPEETKPTPKKRLLSGIRVS